MPADDTIGIEPFVPHEVSGEQLEALADLENTIVAEQRPGDPPRSVAYVRTRYQSWTHFTDEERRHWWALRGGLPVGHAMTAVRRTGDNPHVMFVDLRVAPQARRQGVARRLLRCVVDAARSADRRSLVAEVQGREPLADLPGTAFGYAIGARPRREEHFNRLAIDDVEPSLLEAWLEQGPRRSPEMRLVWWEGTVPEQDLEGMADVVSRTSAGEPTDDLDIEPMTFSAASIRHWMQAMDREGRQAHIAAAKHEPSDVLAGYTMMTTDPTNPTVFDQFGTGVLPEFRRRGLGRWLKAAMLQRMVRLYPERREVRTGNADSNAAMLAINRALGFRPWVASCSWQVSVDDVEAYLARRS